MILLEIEEEKTTLNHNQAFYSQRGRSRDRGRYFTSRGRGFQASRNQNPQNKTTRVNVTSHESSPIISQGKSTICQICGKANHTALKCWNRFDHTYLPEDVPKALAVMTLEE